MIRLVTPQPARRTAIEQEFEIGRKLLANEPLTHREIALLFGISRGRVFQIEQAAMKKLRAALQAEAQHDFS